MTYQRTAFFRLKYRHPQQCDLTWTGRGKRPRWVMAWVAEGRRIEALGVRLAVCGKSAMGVFDDLSYWCFGDNVTTHHT